MANQLFLVYRDLETGYRWRTPIEPRFFKLEEYAISTAHENEPEHFSVTIQSSWACRGIPYGGGTVL